jgi:hypothetical protein
MKNILAHFVLKEMHWRKPCKSAAEPRSSAECSLNTNVIMQVEESCSMILDVILSTGGPTHPTVLCKGELHIVSKICVWLSYCNDQCLPAWVQTKLWRCSEKNGLKRLIPGMNERSSTLTKKKLKRSYVLSGNVDRINSALFISIDIRPMNVVI